MLHAYQLHVATTPEVFVVGFDRMVATCHINSTPTMSTNKC
jgi:hypothetical protein